VDRRGFEPTSSAGSTRKGTKSFQNGISGRVTDMRDWQPLVSPSHTLSFLMWPVNHFESDRFDTCTGRQKMVQNLLCGRVMGLTFWTDLLPAGFVLEPSPRSAVFGRHIDDIVCVLHCLPSSIGRIAPSLWSLPSCVIWDTECATLPRLLRSQRVLNR
jgi:hypothetical protein